jgi:hypothetical protein
MKTVMAFLLSVLSFVSVATAQLAPTSQPTPAQVKPVPCTPSSVVPTHVRLGVPPWLQRQIDKQTLKFGTAIDLKGALNDALGPKPCPGEAHVPTTPAPVPPKPINPIPTPIVTLRCDPIGVDPADPSGKVVATLPDPHKYQTPPPTNHFEADTAEVEIGGSVACAALRVNPATHRYWIPSLTPAAAVDPTPALPQPKK